MKRGMAILAAASLALAMTGPVMAQQPTHGAVANADYSYFDSHPKVARALEKVVEAAPGWPQAPGWS